MPAHGPRRRLFFAATGGALLLASGSVAAEPLASRDDDLHKLLERAEQQYRAGDVDTLMQRLRAPGGALSAPVAVPVRTSPNPPTPPRMPPSVQVALATQPVQAVAAALPSATAARAVVSAKDAKALAVVPPPRALAAVFVATELVRASAIAAQPARSSSPRLDVIAAREIDIMPGTAPPITSVPPTSPQPSAAAPAPPSARPAAAVATPVPPLPPPERSAGDVPRTEIRRLTASQCREILERAQLGSVSAGELQLLRTQCR